MRSTRGKSTLGWGVALRLISFGGSEGMVDVLSSGDEDKSDEGGFESDGNHLVWYNC